MLDGLGFIMKYDNTFAARSNCLLVAIDDHQENLTILQGVLDEYLPEYEFMSSVDPYEGLEIIKKELPDGIILDMQMPELNGIELCRKVKENEATSHIPIILITSHSTTSKLRIEGLSAGADDFISRPIDNTELVARIKVLMRIKRVEDELRSVNLNLDRTVQKKTQELINSEERYRSLFENSKDAICFTNPQGQFIDINNAAIELFAYSREELLKMDVITLYENKEDKKRLRDEIESNGFVKDFEVKVRRKDGLLLDCLVTSSACKSKSETIYEHILRDITELKKAENALRESQNKYQMLVDNSYDIVYSVNPDGIITFISPQISRFGYTPEEVTAKYYSDFIPSEQKEKVVDNFERGLKHDTSLPSTFQWKGKEGNRFWVEVVGKTVSDTAGNVISQIGVMRDVTERVKIDEILSKWAHIFENTGSGIGVFMADTETLDMINPAFSRIHGYKTDELIGKPLRDLFTTGSQADVMDQLRILRKEGHVVFESDNIKENGAVFPAFIDITSVRDADGKIMYCVLHVQDISDRKRAEKERAKLEGQLYQAQKMEAVGTLAAGIAHDFNNILEAILLNTEFVQSNITTDAINTEMLQDVVTSVDRARKLVQQILTFSRQTEVSKRPVKLSPVIKEVLKFMKASLPSSLNISHRLRTENDMVLADPMQIHQVLVNLCNNSAFAMKKLGGDLTIAVDEVFFDHTTVDSRFHMLQGRYVELLVHDSGEGIEDSEMERIFEPFYTTKNVNEGTGLGLSVVYGIVKNHNGEILVDSSPGKGTNITIYLPQYSGETVTETIHFNALVGGVERILVVDDEVTLVKILNSILTDLGYKVTAVTDSLEALHVFEKSPDSFDLVITDLTMPNMDGAVLSDRMVKINSDVPIILCTGFHELADLESKEYANIKTVIKKPISTAILSKVIREILDGTQINGE